jgi:2-oxoglutarate dehydrogenase E2 component (dihydrolipoamide succinyltransferase)
VPAAPAVPGAGKAAAAVMPSAQRALRETGLSADQVTGTGRGGRILKEDVIRAGAAPAPATSSGPSSSRPPAQGLREEEIVPMTTVRRRIAERLVEAQQNAAMLTTFNEVDMTAVQDLRKKYQEEFVKRYDTKVGFMSFFVKACVDALKQFPAVNAEIREKNIVYKNYCDVGVAVGGGKGLVVPVIRDAERLSFAEIESTIKDFGVRAQKNALKLEELQGGTFTITNGGVYGSLLSTPILNPPQSGILGLHGIQDRPVALNGQVVIRPMMYIALTYDHRIVDGREAVTFLRRVKDAIEDPTRMLLEV